MTDDTSTFGVTDSTPFGCIIYNGTEMPIAEVPDAFIRALSGYGHFPGHGRSVVTVPGRTWPHSPETCAPDEYATEWINNQTLVCLGCGLDVT